MLHRLRHHSTASGAPEQIALVLIILGAAPFLAGRLLYWIAEDGVIIGLTAFRQPCPWHELTGIPGPLCGATRAFVHIMHGSPDFLRYNWVWLIYFFCVLLAGAGLGMTHACSSRRVGDTFAALIACARRRPAALSVLGVLALIPPWLVAWLNDSHISQY